MDDADAPPDDDDHENPRTARRRAARSRLSWTLAAVVTMAAALVPAVLWPGDIPWVNDEPRLIAKAYHANREFRLETKGLSGNFGIPYGPLPTHVYQLLLLVTHDPILLAAIRAGLCAGTTAIGLLWLARSLRLNPWFAAAVVLAPYVWMYNRILWDASFAIPIGTLALAAYAAFLRTGSGRSLLLCVACLTGVLFIHPQDLPLFAPIALHMLWRHRPALWRRRVGIAVILAVTLLLNGVYLGLATKAVVARFAGSVRAGYPSDTGRLEALMTPFLGGSLLGGSYYAEVDSHLRGPWQLVAAAKLGSSIVYPLIWLGIGVAGVRWLRRRRAAGDGELDDPADPTVREARHAVFGIALAGLGMLIALYGLMRMPAYPQYFFGTFALHVLFAWVGVDALARVRLGCLATVIYGLSAGYITLASMSQIHRESHDRDDLTDTRMERPTLANQVRVARELNRYSDTEVMTDVLVYQKYGQSLRTLRLLLPPEPGTVQTHSGQLVIRNRAGPTGRDSVIELSRATRETRTARWKPMDVTPLPPGWEPGR
jgi:hypothetical protein